MAQRNKIFFASDLHLGMFPREESLEREKLFVHWLEEIRPQALELWLLGDIFDYWFEYRKVVPRGFTRFLGKLSEVADEGVKIHIFTGNHDVWFFDYLPSEVGLQVHRSTLERTWNGFRFILDHGDGLPPADSGYRFLRSIFKNRFLQWLYARIHPNSSVAFAQWWSRQSRKKKGAYVPFLGLEKEHQLIYARNTLEQNKDIDFFIFGHRHVPFDIRIGEKSRVICLGDWIYNFTYAVFDMKTLELRKYMEDKGEIIQIPDP
jgi:UDP-2,3-diacylglucosamine hydrolase